MTRQEDIRGGRQAESVENSQASDRPEYRQLGAVVGLLGPVIGLISVL